MQIFWGVASLNYRQIARRESSLGFWIWGLGFGKNKKNFLGCVWGFVS